MSTVTPRKVDTLAESESRRALFWLEKFELALETCIVKLVVACKGECTVHVRRLQRTLWLFELSWWSLSRLKKKRSVRWVTVMYLVIYESKEFRDRYQEVLVLCDVCCTMDLSDLRLKRLWSWRHDCRFSLTPMQVNFKLIQILKTANFNGLSGNFSSSLHLFVNESILCDSILYIHQAECAKRHQTSQNTSQCETGL